MQQLFYVPDGATRLYLGIADGGSFQGNPDFYSDNLGTYTARFDISTTVPEPSSVVLIATGLAALFVVRRRRRVF
ncbi:PEP-CTERM sorting domain-containing protein [Gemmatimonas sp.]|uniref:PEP-CTERM sorting domain-containing protein n=1 Tax=Gemmatimonas sp. TaxID=1962908 RepID=UPI00286B4704|nr:PEP-CTERM sorting domain-containing protein [Gemmatimonas sp.]